MKEELQGRIQNLQRRFDQTVDALQDGRISNSNTTTVTRVEERRLQRSQARIAERRQALKAYREGTSAIVKRDMHHDRIDDLWFVLCGAVSF